MTQFDPPPPVDYGIQYGQGVPQPRVSGSAIASLVLGILGCIPLVTGLLAIIFGVIGIRKTRDPSFTGRGLAAAGLVLGIISVLGWTGFGSLLGYGYLESRPAATVAKQFLADVSAGNVGAAATNCTGITAAQLQSQSGQLAQFGALQSVSITSFNYSTANGAATIHLEGIAAFSNAAKSCKFDLTKISGRYLVNSYWVQ